MKAITVVVAMLALIGGGAQAQTVGSSQPLFRPLDPVTANFIKKFTGKDLVSAEIKSSLPPVATLATELDELFASNGCDLSATMKKNIAEKFKTKALIPKDLVEQLGATVLSAKVQKYPNSTANAVLHSITIPAPDGTSRQLTLVGAESYQTRSASEYLDSEASDFAYTMDCSGYLNAVFAAGITVGAAEISSQSAAALKASHLLAVMRGHVFSPTAAAMDVSIGGAKMWNRQRLDLLYAIVAEVHSAHKTEGAGSGSQVQPLDSTPITSWRKIDMIWMSNQGESSMNGRASVSGSGGAGVGIASINTSAGAGGSVERKVIFKKFDTYILDAKLLEPVQRTLKEVKFQLQEEVRRLRHGTPSITDSKIAVLYPDMPEKACLLPWKPSTSTNPSPGWLSTSYDAQLGCKVVFEKASGLADKAVLDLKVTALGIDLNFLMLLP